MMPQFFVLKDGRHFSLPLFLFCLRSVTFMFRSLACLPPFICVLNLLILLLGHERIIQFEMVLGGHFQGVYLHQEVPLVEVLPPLVSIERTLAISRSLTTSALMPDPRAHPTVVDSLVDGVSFEDPLPSNTEE